MKARSAKIPTKRAKSSDDVARPHPRSDCIRIYEYARTAHLERLRDSNARTLIFRKKSYDFDTQSYPEGVEVVQLNRRRTFWYVLINRPRIIEINEPTSIQAWPTTICIAAIAKTAHALGSHRLHLVSYLIDNSDVATTLTTRLHLMPSVGRWIATRVTRFIYSAISRCVFGTPGARDSYGLILGKRQRNVEARMVLALPSTCNCERPSLRDVDVVYLGAFDQRKGVTNLMDAWDATPGLQERRLRILGKGPLASSVLDWSSQRPHVQVSLDPARTEIHRTLARARVLVLLSQKSSFWREQVGLPIVEGLAHGCTIVTTTETGLATWLATNGHAVISPRSSSDDIGDAIMSALASPIHGARVEATLPQLDGRLEADRWLFPNPE